MKDKIFESKLNELVKEIGSIPIQEREKLIMLAKKTQQQHKHTFLYLSGKLIAYHRIMIEFRQQFKESPGLAILIELSLPAPSYS